MFWNMLARSGPSADNCQATSLFMINDEGIWLLKRLRGAEAAKLVDSLPRSWSDWTEDDWLRAAAAVKVRIHNNRIDFPRAFPYYIGWNKQFSNVLGSTIFLPVVDCTRQYINVLLILLSEPDGQRPLVIDDWQRFRPRSWKDWRAWVGQYLGLGPKIPYQPIGGIDRATDGFVNPDNVVPLGAGYALRTDYEIYFLLQNLMLMGQAMGSASGATPRSGPPSCCGGNRSRAGTASGSGTHSRSPRHPGRRYRPRSPIRSGSTECSKRCARPTSTPWTRRSIASSRRNTGRTASSPIRR